MTCLIIFEHVLFIFTVMLEQHFEYALRKFYLIYYMWNLKTLWWCWGGVLISYLQITVTFHHF
jgi:hypothetical protein